MDGFLIDNHLMLIHVLVAIGLLVLLVWPNGPGNED